MENIIHGLAVFMAIFWGCIILAWVIRSVLTGVGWFADRGGRFHDE
jgi:hypothetical protein